LGATVGAGLWWTLRTPVAPRPASVASVMPAELLRGIAEAKQKPVQKPAVTVAKAASDDEITFERRDLNTLRLALTNATKQPISINLGAGKVFDDGSDGVILLKSLNATVQPGGALTEDLKVAALSSAKAGNGGKCRRSDRTEPKLTSMIRYLESHPEVPVPVIQTAVLAILEDAPVDLFARFPRPQADAPPVDSFKVETRDIIAALQLMLDIGADSGKLSQDAQVKIEAMIDPKAHAIAMQYYGISQADEWLYWKHELIEGDPRTRHYALYGIARFYPDIALQMMPRWALETRTAPIYRRAAIGALALTQRPEALPLLQALQRGLVREGELEQCVEPALRYLQQNLANAL